MSHLVHISLFSSSYSAFSCLPPFIFILFIFVCIHFIVFHPFHHSFHSFSFMHSCILPPLSSHPCTASLSHFYVSASMFISFHSFSFLHCLYAWICIFVCAPLPSLSLFSPVLPLPPPSPFLSLLPLPPLSFIHFCIDIHIPYRYLYGFILHSCSYIGLNTRKGMGEGREVIDIIHITDGSKLEEGCNHHIHIRIISPPIISIPNIECMGSVWEGYTPWLHTKEIRESIRKW